MTHVESGAKRAFGQLHGETKMSIALDISGSVEVTAQVVPRNEVVKQARQAGYNNPEKALAAIRIFFPADPVTGDLDVILNEDQTMFRFAGGTVRVQLIPKIFITNTLNSCARDIAKQHEQDHIRDVLTDSFKQEMLATMKQHRALKLLLVEQRWTAVSQKEATKKTIEGAVVTIFNELGRAKARERDTPGEYARVLKTILQQCSGPFYHEVERGDSLNELALFYYGSRRFWPSIYNANKDVIGRDPDLIYPEQQLLIPKKPKRNNGSVPAR